MRTKAIAAATLLAAGVGGYAVVANAEDDPATASCTSAPKVSEVETGQRITVVCTVPKPAPVVVTETVTASPEPSPSTSPSSTPTPTPAPISTSTVPPTAGDCVRPDASNTGAKGTLAAYSGPTTITTPGKVIENVRINGGLTVNADNVTIRNVELVGGGVFVQRANGTLLSHVTGDGMASSSGSDLTVEYSNLGFTDGDDTIHITSDAGTYIGKATFRNNWIHDPIVSGGQHYDGIQVRGAANVTLDCNTFDLGPYKTQLNAPIYFEDANGGYSNARVTRNWINGGAFAVMFGHSDGKTVLSDNRFGGDIHWDVCYAREPQSKPATQTGNTLNGQPFTPCG